MNVLTLTAGAAAVLLCSMVSAFAQDIDVEALKTKIEARSGQYGELTAILDNESIDTALAAFDVMVETGNKTLTELAISAGLSAADTRLRARALWEAMSRRKAFVVQVDTASLDEGEDEQTPVGKWFGEQRSFPVHEVFAETQCLNLNTFDTCNTGSNVTISGIKLDITSGSDFAGSFELGVDGILHGTISNPRLKTAAAPATITFR